MYFFTFLSKKNTVKIIIPLHFFYSPILFINNRILVKIFQHHKIVIIIIYLLTFLIIICKYCLAATKQTRFKIDLYCACHNATSHHNYSLKTYMFTHFKFCGFINEIFIIRKSIVKEFYFIF